MFIERTTEFDEWLARLRDSTARRRIAARIDRCQAAGRMTGDVHPIDRGVSEMRFHFGPGYRVYFAQKRNMVILLLVGGDKRSQEQDINHAIDMLRELKEAGQW